MPATLSLDFSAFGALPADTGTRRQEVSCYIGDDFAVEQHLCDYDCHEGCTSSPANPCVDALCEEHWPSPTKAVAS